MKIVHLCLSNFYVDGYLYQENALVRQHVADGHDVTVVASTDTLGPNNKPSFRPAGRYIGTDGAAVVRLDYVRLLPKKIAAKLRFYRGLLPELEKLAPDVIMCHGISGGFLYELEKYKRRVPAVRIFADSHADRNNSATTWISRAVLHEVFYRFFAQRALHAFEVVLCISLETRDFANTVYGIPEKRLEFFPLGGVIFEDDEYSMRRNRFRARWAIDDEVVLFVQAGKFDEKKKLVEALKAFAEYTTRHNFRYLVAGHVQDSLQAQVASIVSSDKRIQLIGWQDSEQIMDLLCAADVYVQPGSQSATMQMSMSARCALVLARVKSHEPFMNSNGWFIERSEDLPSVMSEIDNDPAQLAEFGRNSFEAACRLLDYRKLAARFY